MLGIDIGSVTLKAVEITSGREGFRLECLAVAPTPPDTISQGVVYDPDQVGEALRTMLATGGFKGKRAVIAVGGQTSLAVRVIEVPKMKDDELRRAIALDLDRHIPFPPQGTIHDFCRIEPPDAPPEEMSQEVLLAAAQEELINGHLKVLQKAGLTPQAIDIEPLALTRSLVNLAGNGYGRGIVAIVHIGASLTEISIVWDGLLRFVRSLPLGGDSFTTAIGQGFIVESAEAENIKRRWGTILLDQPVEPAAPSAGAIAGPPGPAGIPAQARGGAEVEFAPPPEEEVRPHRTVDLDEEAGAPGLEEMSGRMVDYLEGLTPGPRTEPPAAHLEAGAPAAPQEAPAEAPPPIEGADEDEQRRRQVSQALMSVLVDLAREIRSTLDYFATRKNAEVERVILVGGSAKIQNLAEFMTRELGVPTTLGNPFAHLKPVSASLEPAYLEEIAPIMGVATGLAVRDMLE